MTMYYLDASAWVKRHVEEAGSDWMRRVWAERLPLVCSVLGAVEVLSAIVRRCPADDAQAEAVSREVAADRQGFYEISITPHVLPMAEKLVHRHRLRCADAIHLASALLAREALREPLCLVASDLELLSAARAEGFVTLDPQTDPAVPLSPA